MKEKSKGYIGPDILLAYIAGKSDELGKLYETSKMDLVVSNYALYEAVNSLEEGELVLENLKIVLENSLFIVFPHDKSIKQLLYNFDFEKRKNSLRQKAKMDV